MAGIYSLCVKLLTEHHLEFLSLIGGCTGSYESTYVKLPHCWKSHVVAHIFYRERQQQLEELTKELGRIQDEADGLRIKLKAYKNNKVLYNLVSL